MDVVQLDTSLVQVLVLVYGRCYWVALVSSGKLYCIKFKIWLFSPEID